MHFHIPQKLRSNLTQQKFRVVFDVRVASISVAYKSSEAEEPSVGNKSAKLLNFEDFLEPIIKIIEKHGWLYPEAQIVAGNVRTSERKCTLSLRHYIKHIVRSTVGTFSGVSTASGKIWMESRLPESDDGLEIKIIKLRK
ncbi:hypothetical protein SLA2020_060360 [Shorea laevis]